MQIKSGAHAPTGSACPKKAVELFFVVHPKVAKPLFGPFLSCDDAECGRLAIRSPGAVVEACQVDCLDELTRIRAEAHGRVMRAFAAGQGVRHG
ncbi:hypothetical protein [Ectopseudomonas oleovorans]|uniref:Uncharacterized protein n=1 Tax=Ectopseudomonas oleovorans TaxID=301 RepID=A0A3R8X7L5_ECTOL|nr:hypothetical protein [Pseudomonas oleovorans]RRW26504.1 hypothetical protein EGJ44_22190 [Pseudomonas oleovorans]